MSAFPYKQIHKQRYMLLPLLAIVLLIVYACNATQVFDAFKSAGVSSFPKGQVIYIASKTMGLLALGVAALQIIVGYTSSSVSRRLHAVLGVSLLIFALSHWLLFSLAVYQRADFFPWKNLKIWSDGTFYHTGIMFGSLAFWSLIIISMTGFAAKKRIVIAKIVHRFGFTVFSLALIHALMIGTEAQMFWGQSLFVSFFILIVIVILYRWFFVYFKKRY